MCTLGHKAPLPAGGLAMESHIAYVWAAESVGCRDIMGCAPSCPQSYTFLISSDYERAEWRENIREQQKKCKQCLLLLISPSDFFFFLKFWVVESYPGYMLESSSFAPPNSGFGPFLPSTLLASRANST